MEVAFEQLQTADLVVDTIYQGGKVSGKGSEVLSKLMPGCSNSGGFRKVMRKDGSGLPAFTLRCKNWLGLIILMRKLVFFVIMVITGVLEKLSWIHRENDEFFSVIKELVEF